METDENLEKATTEFEKNDLFDDCAAKTKEELLREQKEEEQRKRKERIEEEERKRKERLEETQRERKMKIEEAQRERQRLVDETRLDRKFMVDAMPSTESTDDLRCKEKRRKKREDSESRLHIVCEDNQDSQDTPERSEKVSGMYKESLFILNAVCKIKVDIFYLYTN